MTSAQTLREAILAADLATSSSGETPQRGTLYVPLSHLKIMRLDASLVVGGRGVGKSFWTSALEGQQTVESMPELAGVEVRIGFAEKGRIEHYPDADVFADLLRQDYDPYDVWRTVVLRWIAQRSGRPIPYDSWRDTLSWLKTQPEAAAHLMQESRSWQGLLLFDALDRTSYDWRTMDNIVRGLLRAVLWLKSFRGLHAKVFLREDQAERTVFNFPDASKLLATRAELTWARHDLHGLLWQRLINAPDPHGGYLREIARPTCNGGIWVLPDEMKRESDTQRKAFERLAGPWMGRDRRRGVPYVWSAGHLADGRGLTSPRSFLAAIRQAAEDSRLSFPEHEYALHFESIKRGIQKASEIRVAEVAEDYPWVRDVLESLTGMNVPGAYDEVLQRWKERFPGGPSNIESDRLPPQHADRGWDGIREDLQRLGLIETKKDGRIDMPDLYRVGFRLGRMGGVKPRS